MVAWWTDGSGRYLERRVVWIEVSIQIGVGLVELAAGMAGDEGRESWAKSALDAINGLVKDAATAPAPLDSWMGRALGRKEASAAANAERKGRVVPAKAAMAAFPSELGCGWVMNVLVWGGRRKTWRNKQESPDALFSSGARYNAMLDALAGLPQHVAWASRQLTARGWALSTQEAWAAKLCAKGSQPWLAGRAVERSEAIPLDEAARVQGQCAYAVYVEHGGYQGFLDIEGMPVAGIGQARLYARLEAAKKAALSMKSAAVVRVRVEMEAMELSTGEFDGKELRGELARIQSREIALSLTDEGLGQSPAEISASKASARL